MTAALDAERYYRSCGWRSIPIPAREKGPRIPGWQTLDFGANGLSKYFGPDSNIGVLLGPASGGLVDIDLDCVEALALADPYLLPTGAQFGRASKPRAHRLYVAPGALYETFADPLDGTMLVELRAAGRDGGAHQTLFPPSVHPSGERIEWYGASIEPAAVDVAVLRRRVAWLAIGCLVMRHLSEYAARRPGPYFVDLLQEADPKLGQAARQWLGNRDEPRGHPKPRHLMTNAELRLEEFVAGIPNDGLCWDEWNRIGMAIHGASGGSDEGYIAFDAFSARSVKYDPYETKARWRHYDRSPPTRIGIGTLIYLARQNGWTRRAAA